MKRIKIVDRLDTNVALKVYMAANGVNAAMLADKIGMKRNTLWRKLTGQYEFKISEVMAIGKALNLNREELADIFLQ